MRHIEKKWYCYLVLCEGDGTYYCGVTTDITKRIEKHNSGKGAKYTRGRTPVKLLAKTGPKTKSIAMRMEYEVKKLRRQEKLDYFKRYESRS